MLKLLNELDSVDVEKGLAYIVSWQNLTVDNSTLWGWPSPFYNWTYVSDVYAIHIITHSLNTFDFLGSVNRTALIDVVMARYNQSDGGFYEPLIRVNTEQGEREYAVFAFPLEFHAISDVAYARSNVISTFLCVSILADIDALDMINTTRTADWILSCRGANGAFKPFPESHPEYLPGWSSLITNPFYVDRYGTGVAFTYAALGALKGLGVNVRDVVDVDKVREYVLACQQPYVTNDTVRFLAHPDANDSPAFHLTYYAMMALYYTDALESETDLNRKVTAYLLTWLQDQSLGYEHSWPVPTRGGGWYGLFVDFPPFGTTYFAVSILNATNSLSLLDQPTPVVAQTWTNLLTLSIITSVLFAFVLVAGKLTYNMVKLRNMKTKQSETPPPPAADMPEKTLSGCL